MKFVKPCPRIPGTYPCGHRQALQSSVPGFPAHILADTGKFCKALSQDSRHTSCGHRQALQSPVPGFPAHILRTPASSAKPCPPVTVKQGGMTTAIPCKKKTAVKPPSRILFVFLITYGDSKPEGNSLSCKGTCKGW